MLSSTSVVVLCGGRGTRAWPLTRTVPKPLLPLAGVPALRHLLDVLVPQGVGRVLLAAGHLVDQVEEFAAGLPRSWPVEVVDTGEESGTGERVRRLADRLQETFVVTYGDGLADVDLTALLARHRAAGGLATVTSVPLRSQYGCLDLDGDRVRGFREKPVVESVWINGGFIAMEPVLFDAWPGPDLERDVLPALADADRLRVHRHRGFWASMDTAKDVAELSELAARPVPPWLEAPELGALPYPGEGTLRERTIA